MAGIAVFELTFVAPARRVGVLRNLVVCAVAGLCACSGGDVSQARGEDATWKPGSTTTAASPVTSGGAAAPSATVPIGPGAPVTMPLPRAGAPAPSPPAPAGVPADFTKTQVGGFKLGPALTATMAPVAGATGAAGVGAPGAGAGGSASSQPSPGACAIITGIVRDFKGKTQPQGHPDFEAFEGMQPTPGLVASTLGPDQKPVYASRCEATPDPSACPFRQMTTSASAFDQWYRGAPDVDRPYAIHLSLQPNGGVHTFQSNDFFPLDGQGWGNPPGKSHNFGFTTEVHMKFAYQGGERFSFTGDDDLWVFINGKLAIDLGGLHPPTSAMLDLDARAAELGITKGQSYALDLFHAERHSEASNFRIDTTLSFTDCGSAPIPK
jgi:fibro-slime domain-containing protein